MKLFAWLGKTFDWLVKLINTRGSVEIMERRLALKDDQIAQLKAQKEDEIAILQAKIKELEAAQQNQKIEADEVRLHKGIEFRRGNKTGGKWQAFCPKCHLPAEQCFRSGGEVGRTVQSGRVVTCTARCGWSVFMQQDLSVLSSELMESQPPSTQ